MEGPASLCAAREVHRWGPALSFLYFPPPSSPTARPAPLPGVSRSSTHHATPARRVWWRGKGGVEGGAARKQSPASPPRASLEREAAPSGRGIPLSPPPTRPAPPNPPPHPHETRAKRCPRQHAGLVGVGSPPNPPSRPLLFPSTLTGSPPTAAATAPGTTRARGAGTRTPGSGASPVERRPSKSSRRRSPGEGGREGGWRA